MSIQTEPPVNLHGHTPADAVSLALAGIDTADVQAREHAVRCVWCRHTTFHLAACCDAHYEPPKRTRVGGL